MERYTIDRKLKYILETLGLNQQEFVNEANKLGYALSRQTLNSIINGKNPLPTLPIIHSIVQVCRFSNVPCLQNITYDYLLDDEINSILIKDYDKLSINGIGNLSKSSIEILKMDINATKNIAPGVSYLIERGGFFFWADILDYKDLSELNNILKNFEKENYKIKYDFKLSLCNMDLSTLKKANNLDNLKKYKYDSNKDRVINILDRLETIYNKNKFSFIKILSSSSSDKDTKDFIANIKLAKKLKDNDIDIPVELRNELAHFITTLSYHSTALAESLKYQLIKKFDEIL